MSTNATTTTTPSTINHLHKKSSRSGNRIKKNQDQRDRSHKSHSSLPGEPVVDTDPLVHGQRYVKKSQAHRDRSQKSASASQDIDSSLQKSVSSCRSRSSHKKYRKKSELKLAGDFDLSHQPSVTSSNKSISSHRKYRKERSNSVSSGSKHNSGSSNGHSHRKSRRRNSNSSHDQSHSSAAADNPSSNFGSFSIENNERSYSSHQHRKNGRRQFRSSSSQRSIQSSSSKQRHIVPKSPKKGRRQKHRSHSPGGRTETSSKKKSKSFGHHNTDHVRKPSSESSLDVSKKSQISFQDDTDIGRESEHKQKRRGRRVHKRTTISQSAVETELHHMLGTMNGSNNQFDGPLKGVGDGLDVTLDTTINSKMSTKSNKSKKKKKRSSKSTEEITKDIKKAIEKTPESNGKKSVQMSPGVKDKLHDDGFGDLCEKKSPKRTKSTKSSKSSSLPKTPNKSAKDKKKPKKLKDLGDSRLSGTESSNKKKKTKQKSKAQQGLTNEREQTKAKKKKRPTTTKVGQPSFSNNENQEKTNKLVSDNVKSEGHEANPFEMKDQTSKSTTSPGALKRSRSFDPATSEGALKRSPGSLKRATSSHDELSGGGGKTPSRLRRAKSLFGAVLNPNATKANTVGDGDSDNEYEMKPAQEEKKGLLGWAKKNLNMNSPGNKGRYSPGGIGKKRIFGRSRSGNGEDDEDNDDVGLLSNQSDRPQMSLLDLSVPLDTEQKRPKSSNSLGTDRKVFMPEDIVIEESNSFKMPPLKNHKNAMNGIDQTQEVRDVQELTRHEAQKSKRNDGNSDAPPFSQIISTGNDLPDDDELSDIGDPEANIVPLDSYGMEPETIDGVEFIFTPEKNDIVYDDRGHPGTTRMLHVLREILVEHQDDIEYSPNIYKLIKRRLKGRKFLRRTQHHEGRVAWREATKAENVRLLADFFNTEMRELFGGNITIDEDTAPKAKNGKSRDANSAAGSIRDNLLERAIVECKWAQELAKPNGDIEMMNIGIDAEEKLIALIEIAESGNAQTEPLKEELDKLGELAKQMMYVSIAPLYERLEEIEEHLADYFEQEGEIDNLDLDDDGLSIEGDRSGLVDPRDRSMEKDGEMYEVAMKSESYADENFYEEQMKDDEEESEEEQEQVGASVDYNGSDEDYDDEGDPEHYDDDESEISGTNVKEGEVLNCENTDGEVSSVGESGIYDESESDDDDSELGEDDPNWGEFNDEEESESDQDSDTYEGSDVSDDESDVSDEPKRKKSVDDRNPKLKQFFDRLNHLFETRKRIEECAKTKDPSNKSRKIKAKAHSGGLAKKSGAYKREFQQCDIQKRVVSNFDDLYESAEKVYPDFKSVVQQLVDDISGLDYKKNIIFPPMKPRDKAYEKAVADYSNREPGPPESWLYDIVRASVVCTTLKQLVECGKWLTGNTTVVQAKNRFAEPVFNGYRDLLYHISIKCEDGMSHICEVQVHLKNIYDLNDQCGTIKHYDFFRSCFSNPWRSKEDALADLQKMNRYKKIEGPFMKKLLKSEDPEQLLLFAGIFRKDLEEYDRSLELYRRVLSLQEASSDSDGMAETYLNMGLVQGAMGETDESLQNLLKALAIKESLLGDDHVEVADAHVEIGHMLSKRGDYSGAYTQYQRTQLIRENKLGKDHFLVIKSLQDIGLVLQKKGDFQESENEYRRALAIQKAVLGCDEHVDLATTHSFIAKTLCLYGEFEKALVEDKLAMAMREKLLGKNHCSTADSHSAIGTLLFHTGDYKTSRWHHNKALKIRETMLGKNDQECAITHRHLGELLSSYEGDYEGAVKELKRAQEISESNLGRDHPVTAESYIGLGHIHCRHGKHEEALAEYRRAKVILESNLGQTHPDTAITYLCTGNALNLAGDQDGAMQMHRKALVVFESVLGNFHPLTADGYQSTGDAYSSRGHPEMALSEHREALKIRKAVLKKHHPAIGESLSRIGNILLTGCDNSGNRKERDPQGALEIFREALAITEERSGKDHPTSAVARFDVSHALVTLAMINENGMKKSRLGEAEYQLQDTLKVLREVEPLNKDAKAYKGFFLGFGEEAAITGRACLALGTVLEQQGNGDEAKDMFVEGLERLISTLGGDHPDTLQAESKLLSFVAES